jgi:cytochrome P450
MRPLHPPAADSLARTRAQLADTSLLLAARPDMAALLLAGRLLSSERTPLRRLPSLGWVTAHAPTAREILKDYRHFTNLTEGGVGDLWAQVLGPWVLDMFDGPGHHDLRTRTRELFTEDSATALVAEAWQDSFDAAREELVTGGTLDIAALSRTLVGQMMGALLGIDEVRHDPAAADELFAAGERLAGLALDTATDTTLAEDRIARAQEIVGQLTAHVPAAYTDPRPGTILERCVRLGLGLRETTGLCALLMVAGTETSASAMARTVALLADTGDQHLLRRDRSLLPEAVREGLRVTTPASVIGRGVSADVEVAGARMRAGERVMMLTWTANTRCGGFDLRRGYVPEVRQLWFGAGRHLCLGAPLARAEIAGLLTMLLDAAAEAGAPGWQIVERSPQRKVMIPGYQRLVVALA